MGFFCVSLIWMHLVRVVLIVHVVRTVISVHAMSTAIKRKKALQATNPQGDNTVFTNSSQAIPNSLNSFSL